MTTPPLEPERTSPARAGAGCLGVGCMSFFAFFVFLAVVAIGGGTWGLLKVRKNYSSTTPLAIPEVQTTETNDTLEGEVTPPPPPTAPIAPTVPPLPSMATPEPTRAPAAASAQNGSAVYRWKEFQRAARRHEPAHIELTADDINALIASGRNTRGKAFVSIENNVGHVTVSVPLEKVMFMGGRFLNGQGTIRASPDGDPAKVQITDVTIGAQAVPDDFLDRRIFGWDSIRGYIKQWLDQENVGTFRIENNRAIGDTRG